MWWGSKETKMRWDPNSELKRPEQQLQRSPCTEIVAYHTQDNIIWADFDFLHMWNVYSQLHFSLRVQKNSSLNIIANKL